MSPVLAAVGRQAARRAAVVPRGVRAVHFENTIETVSSQRKSHHPERYGDVGRLS